MATISTSFTVEHYAIASRGKLFLKPEPDSADGPYVPTPLTTWQRFDALLVNLPRGWVIGHRDEARLVLGPSGSFVLVPGAYDLALAAEQAHRLAQHCRTAMARHLNWVPFVDAAVVTATDQAAEIAAIIVPIDLLTDLLTQGPQVIDPIDIKRIEGLLLTGDLDGWKAGTSTSNDKIAACEPPHPVLALTTVAL